ncbi:hypothetical protein KKI24_23125 [bacterium]|nr:hypothetical protein [bacterium]
MVTRKTAHVCFLMGVTLLLSAVAALLPVEQTAAQQSRSSGAGSPARVEGAPVTIPAGKGDDLSTVNWDDATDETPASQEKTGDSDLSKENWEDEKSSKDVTEKEAASDLSKESWEDEGSAKNVPEKEDGLQMMKQEEIDKLDSRERLIHLSGFALFIGYILGGVLTAFATRNRKLAVSLPPELLILLHTFWPLELILLPFMRARIR